MPNRWWIKKEGSTKRITARALEIEAGLVTCPKCKVKKPLSEYGVHKQTTHGIRSRCRKCEAAETKFQRHKDPEANRKRNRDRYREDQKGLEYNRKWGLSHPEVMLDRRLKKYNIDACRLEQMRTEQGDKCAICGRCRKSEKKDFHIDHDHACCPGKNSCGKCIRGLLCYVCNHFLGAIKDDVAALHKAILYLERAKCV